MVPKEVFAGVGSAMAFLVGLVTVVINHIRIKLFINKIVSLFCSTTTITFPEYTASSLERSKLFVAIEAYISSNCTDGVHKLVAEFGSAQQRPHFLIDDAVEIIDIFEGTTLWWHAYTLRRSGIFFREPGDEERRFYRVVFHNSFRDKFEHSYLPHVFRQGHTVIANNCQRRLFTNTRNPSREICWSHMAFRNPATFHTLAMDPTEKQAIIDDLDAFRKGKDYYEMLGKAWKRGYLLFGPPGTGKSTMIAAISNYLSYDIYDLELTVVNDNTELRKLFNQTKEKSIIVIEDIDRSIDIIHKSRDKKSSGQSDSMTLLPIGREEDAEDTKLTLSGILSFIDGLSTACCGERMIIFTSNNKDMLDPALIRPGRMDKHIKMSYCRFEAFKVLATNYLSRTTITDHHVLELFPEIGQLLEEVNMTPAEVIGYLMCTEQSDADACLKNLMEALKMAKFKAATRGKGKAKEAIEETVQADVVGSRRGIEGRTRPIC